MNPRRITRIAMTASTYAASTLVTMLILGWIAWGPVQFRISEALTVLVLLTADVILCLTLRCAIANIVNIGISGLGTLGLPLCNALSRTPLMEQLTIEEAHSR